MDFKRAAIDLWQIIDDIDTYSDMAKENDEAFRKAVENKVHERHKILESDGHNLFTPVSEGYDQIT